MFEQLVFQVKQGIARGTLKAGDKLPSVRELAKQCAVNPNTVVRALEVLANQGVIVRRQGAGTFVREGGSELANQVKRERLREAMERVVTEAFHLGFDTDALRKALEKAMRDLGMRDE